jgi:predicted nucleotidyltransferase
MNAASDVDLLVEFDPAAKVDLVDHAGLMLDLSQLMGAMWIWCRSVLLSH